MVCSDGMKRAAEEMAVNDAVGNEELKRKDFDPSLKPEGQNFARSPVTCLSVRGEWLERSENDCLAAMKGKDLNRCIASLDGSEPLTTSSTIDTGLFVEELTVGNYRNQNLDLVSSPNKAKQGQWQYLYQLASGSRSKGSQGDLASTGKDQILLRVREELVTMNSDPRSLKLLSSKLLDPAPKGVFAYMRASEDKIISSNSLSTTPARLKTLSTSSFSQLFVKKSLAGKGSICGAPEACSGFGGAIGDQNDEKRHDVTKVASSALLKLSANNGQSSTHRIDRSGPEPFNDGISLREWLKPGHSKLNKAESVLIFRQIVELVDFAHSQGVVLNDLRPSCFFLLQSSRIKYTGSSTAVRELEGVMCQESFRKRPLEQDEHAYLSLGAKQRRICEEMNSIRQQPYFMTNGGLSTKSMKETEISITGPEDSGHTELQSQNNSSCQNKSLATQQTLPVTVHRCQNKSLAAQQYVSATVQSEEKWYTSPEDLNERGCTFSSNIYGLGVLFFELLCIFESCEAHSVVMLDLRHRILPPNFLSENPREAGFCLWLLHPEPSSRPTTSEILQSELLFGSQELHSGDDFSVSGSVDDGESEPLLHFLISLKEQKQNHASKLAEDIECLEEDIKLAERRHLIGTSTAFSCGQEEIPNVGKLGFHLLDSINSGASPRSFSVSKLNEERLMNQSNFFLLSCSPLMDAAAVTRIKTVNLLASYTAGRKMNTTNLIQPSWPSTQPQTLALYASGTSSCGNFPGHQRCPCPKSKSSIFSVTRCSTKPGIDSNNATNKNPAIERDPSSKSQQLAAPVPNQALTSTCSRGLVLDLGPKNSWDSAEIGSPVVKRYIGDNEERWYMWYHGRSDINNNTSESIGLAVSSNGIHWAREEHVRSSGDAGLVMNCSKNWWAFDTDSIRPSEMVIMSSPMYSAVYWLYYTGYSSEEVKLSGAPNILQNPERVHGGDKKDENHKIGKIFKSLPGLACSQDGRHWARIEGDHHSGALLDVGSDKEWDSLFIAAPHVVVHSNDDLRMYYHSYDVENGQFALGVARSRDGIRWVKLGKILGGGSKGSFDEIGVKNACVVRNSKEGNYLMAYEGVSADGMRCIGLAVSPDGLKNWTRLQEDPLLKPSEDDGWDNKGVGSPCLIQMEGNVDKWRLYYVGVGCGGRNGIGLAVSEGSNIGKFRRWADFTCNINV